MVRFHYKSHRRAPTSIPNGRLYLLGIELMVKDDGYRWLKFNLMWFYFGWSWEKKGCS